MSSFEMITVEMVGGELREFVARRHECWKLLRPARVKDDSSANIRGNMPMIEVPPGDWPNTEVLSSASADLGVEVFVEDWNDPAFPTLCLRMTADGWAITAREAL